MASLTPQYGWNGSRYYDIDNGQFVSFSDVRVALDEVIDAAAANMNSLSVQLQNGTISLADWQNGMMENIKLTHTASGAAANGGWAQMTQSDWGAVGQGIREQYDYVRNFAAEIVNGDQPLDGRFLVRTDMYSDAGRGTFEDIRYRGMVDEGYEEERRILEPGADHCDGCESQAQLGWQPLGELDDIGEEECGVRCKCDKIYRRRLPDGGWEESD